MVETEAKAVERLLGRKPKGPWTVCLYDLDGEPLVLETSPILDDGTPMPTIFWLLGRELRQDVSRVESRGGVKWADTHIDMQAVADSHDRYRQLRDSKIPDGYSGIRPYGGVGGTRVGVKCLHAHVAWQLMDGNDPVGLWTLGEIQATRLQES